MASNVVSLDIMFRHLVLVEAEAFKTFEKNSSVPIDKLIQGVNFRYKDRIWNFRIAVVAIKGIEGIFMRAHSSDGIHGKHSEFQQASLWNRLSPSTSARTSPRKSSRDTTTGTIKNTTIGCSSGIKFSAQEEYEPDGSLAKVPTFFSKLLTDGASLEGEDVPKVSEETIGYVRGFFKKCPQLIPEGQ